MSRVVPLIRCLRVSNTGRSDTTLDTSILPFMFLRRGFTCLMEDSRRRDLCRIPPGARMEFMLHLRPYRTCNDMKWVMSTRYTLRCVGSGSLHYRGTRMVDTPFHGDR